MSRAIVGIALTAGVAILFLSQGAHASIPNEYVPPNWEPPAPGAPDGDFFGSRYVPDMPAPDTPQDSGGFSYDEVTGQTYSESVTPADVSPWAMDDVELGAGITIMNSLRLSDAGLLALQEREGLSLTPYQDSAGYWTVGYGHKLLMSEARVPVTRERASELLRQDVTSAENAVNTFVKVPLFQGQFDALVSLVYNIGVGAFQNSTLLRLLNAGQYADAAAQFLAWKFAGGAPVLLNRRRSELAQFENAFA